MTRFRDEFTVENLPKLQYARERLTKECTLAWKLFLDEFNSDFKSVQLGIKCLSEIDALYALAVVSKGEGFCKPSMISSDVQDREIRILAGRNIVVEAVLPVDKPYVPHNTVFEIGQTSMLLTGT